MGVSSWGVLRQVLLTASLLLFIQVNTHALPRTWIGGNVDWVDGGSNANWTPADEPDPDDEAIFNTSNSVKMGSANSIQALTLSGGIDLFTNDFSLTVDGLVQLSGAGTNLFIGGSTGSVNADDVTINSSGVVELTGGLLTLNQEVGTSLLDINSGGLLQGNGTITFADKPLLPTTLLINDGTLTALSRGLLVFSPPPIGTLQINDSSLGGRIDLDGTGTAGVVNVNRNQTLDINVPLSDNFAGTLNLFQNATFEMSNPWTLDGGSINANNGFVDNSLPNPDIPADVSTITGAMLTQTGGTINISASDGTLRFNAPFTMNGGTLVNRGLIIFNNDATISAGATVSRTFAGASLTVEPGRIVTITTPTFDMDGANTNASVITVNSGATLAINTNQYDPDEFPGSSFEGIVNLNGGDIVVFTSFAEFVMNGTLNMDSSSGSSATWAGEPLTIGNDLGVRDAVINVLGGLDNNLSTNVTFNSDADVNIPAGSQLRIIQVATATFNTVNGGNNAGFTGAGTLEFNNAINFNEAVTFNMFGGRINLSGSDVTGATVSVDAPVVVNVAHFGNIFGNYGNVNTVGGPDTLDIDARTAGTSGILTVNLDNPIAEWVLDPTAVMNLSAPNSGATLLAGSDVNLNGTVNVTGAVGVDARVLIGGTVNILTTGGSTGLVLQGGVALIAFNDPDIAVNRLIGGTINGPGTLRTPSFKALLGFGTINAPIDFDGMSNLFADNGMLTINGAILDVNSIGTIDADGILNVTNPWNTAVASGLDLVGGEVRGATITNDALSGISATGIHGTSLLSSRVINNTVIDAISGGTFVIETVGNDNDWDGTTNTGAINTGGDVVIELRDNATFGFSGSVRAKFGGTVFTNGFALDFNPGSLLELKAGTYQSTHSTDIGGSILVDPSDDSTIEVQVNRFLTLESSSSTTLDANLRLVSNNARIQAGASFSGAGAIVIPEDSHLVADNLANIGVLLEMQGTFRPGGFDTVGRIDLLDYQQANTGELFVELTGTSLNQFDRLVLSGDAVIDGYLNIDIDGGFIPALNNTFNIITGNTVTGVFNQVDVSGMPAGLTFHINYLSNAVQLQVVNTPFFSADFDHDGDVDATDLGIWKAAYNLNQLGDADGDNDTDGGDFLAWQRQFGSSPLVAAATAVPEPGTILFVFIGMFLAGSRKF